VILACHGRAQNMTETRTRVMVERRHVFHIAGYDPTDRDGKLRRFRRSLSNFSQTWNVTAQVSDLAPAADDASARWTVETHSSNWRATTTYEILRWDDIILADSRRPMPSRLFQGLRTLYDWVVSGTLFRYFRTSWKYSLFFLVPYLYLLLFALIAIVVGQLVASLFALNGAPGLLVKLSVTFAIFVGLLYWLGRRWHVLHILDDWIFAKEFVHGRRPDMDARLALFADKIIVCAKAAAVDEIVIVGHCLGAALVIDVIARALARDPDVARHGPTLCVLTVGATIPKFALHPAGERFRRAARRIAGESSIQWAEYQARDDAISFYRVDPVKLSRIGADHKSERPVIRRVQLHEMMSPEMFRRHRFNFMRLHYQSVSGNDKRSAYDHFMFICGPFSFERLVADRGAIDLVRPDGSVVETDAGVPAEPRSAAV
jgi:hypothetical protein